MWRISVMALIHDYLLTHTWWKYDAAADWYASPYHFLNLAVQGCAWLVFAALVLLRYLKHRRSLLELPYALAFALFGLTDFREAYALQSWLILLKGLNLGMLLWLRHIVIRRCYPASRVY